MQLRPAQQKILEYTNGYMAISAVPGSGKTFTLSLLAAELIAQGRINTNLDQQVLIVTYLNASVDTFRARIRRRLEDKGLPITGFDVRTLHSLSLEIVRLSQSELAGNMPIVLDDTQQSYFLSLAIDRWIEHHTHLWQEFLHDLPDSPRAMARWRTIVEKTASALIRTAKNERYRPEQILDKLHRFITQETAESDENPQTIARRYAFTEMMAGIYAHYQNILMRQAAMDFDDLIWQATDLIEEQENFAEQLRQRWPYVLEDEAQDSVPLQEALLEALTGPNGNWVRVGDPNQAITSTFTAAHPRFFNAFIDRPDVRSLPLPNSGRSAPLIIDAANTLLNWVIDHHPVPEVRRHAFRRQNILPTPPGDAQPNPPNSEANIRIKVFKHREDEELPAIARLATRYAQKKPEHTLAILVPTNRTGYQIAEHLDELDADYDMLLRGGGREREIAAAMHALLAVLANPLDKKQLVRAHETLYELGHPAARVPEEQLSHLHRLLVSVSRPESVLYPWQESDMAAALPAGRTTETDLAAIGRFAEFLRRIFSLRALPIDDLALALGDELFSWGEAHEGDLIIAYQIANVLRQWRTTQPEWRLPELVAQLEDVVAGRRRLPIAPVDELGYEPTPGRITLTTQHSAKGLEWDAVFLVGIDGMWIPGSLDAPFVGEYDFLGGDPTAEVVAQLRYIMAGDAGIYPGRTPTETARIDIICERLRLLYVGITRARRYLHISRSRATRVYNKDRESEPATVMGVLYRFLKQREEKRPSSPSSE